MRRNWARKVRRVRHVREESQTRMLITFKIPQIELWAVKNYFWLVWEQDSSQRPWRTTQKKFLFEKFYKVRNVQFFVLISEKSVKIKSFIESKMSAPSRIRTRDLSETALREWNFLSETFNLHFIEKYFSQTLNCFIVRTGFDKNYRYSSKIYIFFV